MLLVRSLALGGVVLASLSVAVGPAAATPYVRFTGYILGSNPGSFELGGDTFFLDRDFDFGLSTATEISGFASLNGISPGDLTAETFDSELVTPSRTEDTFTGIYGNDDALPSRLELHWQGQLMVDSNDLAAVAHCPVVGPGTLDCTQGSVQGSYTLFSSASPLGSAFRSEVSGLTGGTNEMAWSADITSIIFDGTDDVISWTVTHRPVVATEDLTGGAIQEVAIGGGLGASGGVEIEINPDAAATISADYTATADPNDLIAETGVLPPFRLPGEQIQFWDLSLVDDQGNDVGFSGPATLVFVYDDTLLGDLFDEDDLQILHFTGGQWVALNVLERDTVANTLTVQTDSFSIFAAAVPEPGTSVLVAAGLVLLGMRRRD